MRMEGNNGDRGRLRTTVELGGPGNNKIICDFLITLLYLSQKTKDKRKKDSRLRCNESSNPGIRKAMSRACRTSERKNLRR